MKYEQLVLRNRTRADDGRKKGALRVSQAAQPQRPSSGSNLSKETYPDLPSLRLLEEGHEKQKNEARTNCNRHHYHIITRTVIHIQDGSPERLDFKIPI